MDPDTGKVTTKLVLEDKEKPPSKLSHSVRDAPGDAALGKIHKEIRETDRTMWAWKAPTSPKKLPRQAFIWFGRAIAATN